MTEVAYSRRFQFSLRKLMLWMMVVAVYLGTVLQLNGSEILLMWLVVVGIVRMAFGWKVAFLSSAVTAGLLAVFAIRGTLGWRSELLSVEAVPVVLPVIGLGALCGCFLFTIVELAFTFVDWADRWLGKRS